MYGFKLKVDPDAAVGINIAHPVADHPQDVPAGDDASVALYDEDVDPAPRVI